MLLILILIVVFVIFILLIFIVIISIVIVIVIIIIITIILLSRSVWNHSTICEEETHTAIQFVIHAVIVGDEVRFFVVLPLEDPSHVRKSGNAPPGHVALVVNKKQREAIIRAQIRNRIVDDVAEVLDHGCLRSAEEEGKDEGVGAGGVLEGLREMHREVFAGIVIVSGTASWIEAVLRDVPEGFVLGVFARSAVVSENSAPGAFGTLCGGPTFFEFIQGRDPAAFIDADAALESLIGGEARSALLVDEGAPGGLDLLDELVEVASIAADPRKRRVGRRSPFLRNRRGLDVLAELAAVKAPEDLRVRAVAAVAFVLRLEGDVVFGGGAEFCRDFDGAGAAEDGVLTGHEAVCCGGLQAEDAAKVVGFVHFCEDGVDILFFLFDGCDTR